MPVVAAGNVLVSFALQAMQVTIRQFIFLSLLQISLHIAPPIRLCCFLQGYFTIFDCTAYEKNIAIAAIRFYINYCLSVKAQR